MGRGANGGANGRRELLVLGSPLNKRLNREVAAQGSPPSGSEHERAVLRRQFLAACISIDGALGQNRSRGILRLLDVRLVERVYAERAAAGGSGDLPAQELRPKVVRGRD